MSGAEILRHDHRNNNRKKKREDMLNAVLFLLGAIGVVSESPLVVVLPDGTQLQGGAQGTVTYFKGIPYAQPPVNDLRFSPPKPWVNKEISKVIDATKHGHACLQPFWGDDGLFDDGSEDCLTLNVFVSNNSSDSHSNLLPVGIFVHGGSYVNGASFLPLYDGIDLVAYMEGKAILVTVNYRLNVFGFSGSESLRAQDPENGSTGNYGIQDQRLAFDWVRNNIGMSIL